MNLRIKRWQEKEKLIKEKTGALECHHIYTSMLIYTAK
jgi:hypothetical protein